MEGKDNDGDTVLFYAVEDEDRIEAAAIGYRISHAFTALMTAHRSEYGIASNVKKGEVSNWMS